MNAHNWIVYYLCHLRAQSLQLGICPLCSPFFLYKILLGTAVLCSQRIKNAFGQTGKPSPQIILHLCLHLELFD